MTAVELGSTTSTVALSSVDVDVVLTPISLMVTLGSAEPTRVELSVHAAAAVTLDTSLAQA